MAISCGQKPFPLDTLQIPCIIADLEIENAIGGSPVRGVINLTKKIHRLHSYSLPKAIEESPADFRNSLIFTALNVALFVVASWLESLFVLAVAGFISVFRYGLASEEFVNPEHQSGSSIPAGPWFCPNQKTSIGEVLFRSLIWPVFFGLIAPIVEAYTRPQRVEQTLSECTEQLSEQIPAVCRFYKKNAQRIAEILEKDAQWAKETLAGKRGWIDPCPRSLASIETCAGAGKDLKAWLKFLRKFDPSIPRIEN